MKTPVQIYHDPKPGYHPIVYSGKWSVQLLNYSDVMYLDNIDKVRRHLLSEEVCIMLKGRAVLCYIEEGQWLQVVEFRPGLLYTISRGLWHVLIAVPESRFAVITDRDTCKRDAEARLLSEAEHERLLAQAPKWLRRA